jgi:hypothetical protein
MMRVRSSHENLHVHWAQGEKLVFLREASKDWWIASKGMKKGLLPAPYVRALEVNIRDLTSSSESDLELAISGPSSATTSASSLSLSDHAPAKLRSPRSRSPHLRSSGSQSPGSRSPSSQSSFVNQYSSSLSLVKSTDASVGGNTMLSAELLRAVCIWLWL